ncbi:hypothetical protein ACFFWC_30420 [Plantactinospora siamensis]|uniref:Uncharacterized protein n=1 Tax=Plantactinospora siamensis TaxID=555372 RepID=A0ABV6P718_9ACTN
MSTPEDLDLPRPIQYASALFAAAVALAVADALAAISGLRRVSAGSENLIRVMDDKNQALQVIAALRAGLHWSLAIAIITAVIILPLAFAVRRPSRRIRVVLWVLPVVAWMVLGCGLTNGPEISSYNLGTQGEAIDRAWSDMLPSWYIYLHAINVFLILAAVTTAALLLTKRELAEFYGRGDPRIDADDRWSHLRRDGSRPA